MSKPEWGKKHTCHSCDAKYYDFRKSPVICPKCGVEFDPEGGRSRRGRAAKAKAEAVVAATEDDDDILVDDDSDAFPDDEELLHLDDDDNVDDDDEDLQTVSGKSGGISDD
ncbi:TIGR02300 family protein [Kiloniella laminariae]|uniref:TIGR02300 family protein n=1 Tax=Kiloniella laminariae TaxID=454162 RepID=A0ABT4LN75_9PROT|nr:TIGR02300 family protein [Kiloniella laminariae]MCZ4281397.1 TIGR02300 family protein [Kiloniella laminariae]